MKKILMINRVILFLAFILIVSSCSNPGPGYEFMPNMYRSPSLETYGQNSVFEDSSNARLPVKGTIARNYLSTFYYEGSLQGYLEAGENAVNPFLNDEVNIEEGKKLYSMFCQHCHGEFGAGGGSITHPVYSAIPHYNDSKMLRRANVPMNQLTSGHIFHALTYGLNAMGPHSSQLSEEERWKITIYVQELQKYNAE
jgi:mono/diheme cytochrome c family protein|tara:strand:- start:1263 stop:1853 length:591 start_codon:yes stop_codon:yes gene_type:complete